MSLKFLDIANSSRWAIFVVSQPKSEAADFRVNSRLDVSFMLEVHFIRGLSKMRLRVGIALIIMLALVYGAVTAGAKNQMRSLVRKIPYNRVAWLTNCPIKKEKGVIKWGEGGGME